MAAARRPTYPELAERAVLVTGAARGIGRAVATAFVEQRAQVFPADLDEEAGEAAAARLRTAGGRARALRVDVRQPASARAMVEATLAAIATRTPLGRLAIPEDHAAAALFLAPDGAAFITGVCLDVTGGRVML